MITKRLAALLTLGALLSTASPALAVTQNGSVTVTWNYAITATLKLVTQDSTGTGNTYTMVAPAANDIYWGSTPAASAVSGCDGTTATAIAGKDGGGGNGAWAASTVNFGDVVADPTNYTDCLEINAVDAYIVTNDSQGANLDVYYTSGAPSDYNTATNGSLLCIMPAGGQTWSTTGNTTFSASNRSATVAIGQTTASGTAPAQTCGAAGETPIVAAGTTNGNTLLALTKPTTGSDINQDMELVMGPQMQSGLQTMVVTYAFITN
jgi:hypothetical protein